MLRKAILIGSDDASPSNPLPGATKDIEALSAFLLTAQGGAWDCDEIDWYPKLSSRELETVLAGEKTSHDYLFIATMLHGARGPQGSSVYLGSEAVRVVDLVRAGPRAKRVLVLSGGCRSDLPAYLAPPALISEGGLAGVPSAAYVQSCRAAFDTQVMRAPEGGVAMFACAAGEESWYVQGYGGVFTQLLLREAERWSSATSNGDKAQKYLSAEKALGVVREPTAALVRQMGHVQTPEIRPQNPSPFPFVLA